MPDFQHVDHPIFSPTTCVTCSASRDARGFVDLLVDFDLPVNGNAMHGRLYMCATCIDQAARHTGCLNRQQADDLTARLQEALDELSQVRAELEHERSDEAKLISLADARTLLRPDRPRKSPAPTAA